jgi:hypothetical protein
MNRKRGILNIAGTALKVLFGTATEHDVKTVQNAMLTVNEKQENLMHFVNEQTTYLKSLRETAQFNSKSVGVLADKVKSLMLDSQRWLEKTDLAVHLLNVTIFNETSVFTYLRKLEFSLLQLQLQIKELKGGIQDTLTGRLSMNLISPKLLYDILRNLTLSLPDGYTLFTSINKEDIHLYYESIAVTVLVDKTSIKLMISVPFKTFHAEYQLLRVITLPHRVAKLGKYV